MPLKEHDIYERCENFTVAVIQLFETLDRNRSNNVIANQLLRSSSSVGANLYEADAGRSRKEFISCLGISLKEIQESIYWLKILKRPNLKFESRLVEFLKEADIIRRILGKIYWSAKDKCNV